MIRRRARALANFSVLAMLSVGAITAAGPAAAQATTDGAAAHGTSSADSVIVTPDNWGWE